MINVYFISGMGAGCSVFDNLRLPGRYKKCYIEWKAPAENETLESYTKKLIKEIDTSKPFALVGYSFGGIIVQEMNKYITPEKTILVASIRNKQEEPFSFRAGRFLRIEKLIKPWLFNDKLIAWFFNNLIYRTKKKINVKEYLPQLNAPYMRWAIQTILHWLPTIEIAGLYRIHGTKDLTLPYKRIASGYDHNASQLFSIDQAGHLLVLEKPKETSDALRTILEKD